MPETPVSFLAGWLLGLSAGMAPGPLTALLISATVRYRLRGGVQVALVPLFTDLPIVLLALLVLAPLAASRVVLGVVSVLGSLFVLYLAWESLSMKSGAAAPQAAPVGVLRKGIATNFLNPHPYLFWMGVGGPLLLQGWRQGPGPPLLFAAGFYLALVGSKLAIALVVARFGQLLDSRLYLYFNRLLGLALLVFAVLFLRDGLALLELG
jgi:threonine/homoserine/homoserine lactone efflux protein